MVTIKDVAKLSGVSIKTVSRVVNNLSEVSPETRRKVQQAISTLGYQPNTMARSLVKGRTNTVGVIIPHSTENIFDHPFFTEVLRGIAEETGRLAVQAEFAGQWRDVSPLLRPGTWLGVREPLGVLIDPQSWVVDAYVEQRLVDRIESGAHVTFLPHNSLQALTGEVLAYARTT